MIRWLLPLLMLLPCVAHAQFSQPANLPSTYSPSAANWLIRDIYDRIGTKFSTSKAGLVPKAPADATHYLRSDGAWASVSGSVGPTGPAGPTGPTTNTFQVMTGADNEQWGQASGNAGADGSLNTCLGAHSMSTGTGTGIVANTAVGAQALEAVAGSSVYNTGVGWCALQDLSTSGRFNTALGALAGASILGSFTTAYGCFCLGSCTGSDYTVAMGYNAASNSNVGNHCTVIGAEACAGTLTNYNTVIGALAEAQPYLGGHYNTMVGGLCGHAGAYYACTSLGYNSMYHLHGLGNIAIGYNAGSTGHDNETTDNTLFIGSSDTPVRHVYSMPATSIGTGSVSPTKRVTVNINGVDYWIALEPVH